MEITQIIALISIVVLTTIATIIGIQIILLLKEVRRTLGKLNQAINATENAMERLSQPVSQVLGVVEGIKQSTKIIETIGAFLNRHHETKTPNVLKEPYEF